MCSPATVCYLYNKDLENEGKRLLPLEGGPCELADRSVYFGLGGWRTALLFSGVFEIVGYVTIQLTLFLYLNKELHVPVSSAANLTTNFLGTLVIIPLILGFVAEAFPVRCCSIVLASIIQVIGLLKLVMSSTISSPKLFCHPWIVPPGVPLGLCEPNRLMFCTFVLCMVAAGTGGFRSATGDVSARPQRLHAIQEKKSQSMKRPEFGLQYRLPSASIAAFALLLGMISVPRYDTMVQAVRKILRIPTGITAHQKIGLSLILATLAMVVASLIEKRRATLARNFTSLENSQASVFGLLPQAMGVGLANSMSLVGLLDMYYQESPRAVRSTACLLSLTSQCLGYFLSSLTVSIVHKVSRNGDTQKGWLQENLNQGRLDLFYLLLAGFGSLNFVLFFLSVFLSSRCNQARGENIDVVVLGTLDKRL